MISRILLLAILFASLQGEFSLANLIGGAAIAAVIFALLPRRESPYTTIPPRKYLKLFSFIAYFLGQVLVANLRVARDVLSPKLKIRPGIIAIPLDAKTDAEITILFQVIVLTPGTLAVDVSPNRETIYVHALDIPDGDPEKFISGIKNGFERRLLEVMR